jgi:DNA-directed RNA polymerase specialized sigma24 family protein
MRPSPAAGEIAPFTASEESHSPEQIVLARQAAVDLLLSLTMRQRLVALALALGLSTREAAAVAGEVSPRAARARVQRARERVAARSG